MRNKEIPSSVLIRLIQSIFYSKFPYLLYYHNNMNNYRLHHTLTRVCLKNAFCKIYVTICGRFCLNEGGVAGYVNRMKTKYTAKWGM